MPATLFDQGERATRQTGDEEAHSAPNSLEAVLADVEDGSVEEAYLKLLKRCATEGYPVGVLDDAVIVEALTDWEVAMCLPLDCTVDEVKKARHQVTNAVVEDGHRKGYSTYRLHPTLT